MASITTGMIGFGLAGGVLHAPVIASVPRLRVTRVATSRASDVRARCPDATVGDAAAVLGDPAIELVVIATPNESHAALARAALDAGKHVVVDKPFVLDIDDGASLIRLARDRGRVLSVFQNRRWDGDFLTVEQLVRDGRLGAIGLAELRWDRFRPAIKQGWREQPRAGSGLLADLGPHLIDQALRLFGRPDALSADIARQRSAALVDDYFEISLRYDHLRVTVSASTLVAAPRPRFALHGTGGSFVKYGIDPQEAVLRAGGSATDPGFGEEHPRAYGTITSDDGTTAVLATQAGCWRQFYEGMADAIRDGAPPPVDPADALAGLKLIALARQSASESALLSVDA